MCDTEYTYELIATESDARLCAQLLAEEFTANNPITIFDRVSADSFHRDCTWPLTNDMYKEGLSFLARYRPSNEIVAAVIAGDLYTYHQRHPYNTQSGPQAIPVSDLLDEMDNSFIERDFGQELKPTLVLHITVGAVRADHCGKGVATQVRQAMCNFARDQHGFGYALVQITNPVTGYIYMNKMGGEEVTVVDPTTWKWKKKDDGSSMPYKDYTGGLITNILLTLKSNEIFPLPL